MHVKRALEDVGLWPARNRFSATPEWWDGEGRPSIAIAIVGNSEVVPFFRRADNRPRPCLRTTNMETFCRQGQTKEGHGPFILTTHAMDEAEVLSTRIAIMAYGKLQTHRKSAEAQEYLRWRIQAFSNFKTATRHGFQQHQSRVSKCRNCFRKKESNHV